MMRKTAPLLLLILLLFSSCAGGARTRSVDVTTETQAATQAVSAFAEETREAYEKEETGVKLTIDGRAVPVEWEDNESVAALLQLAPLTIEMSMYGGFEQVGSIGRSLPRNDSRMTTSCGDVVLYSGDRLVVFYGSNSWEYTKLGRISLSQTETAELLSNGDVTIEITKG